MAIPYNLILRLKHFNAALGKPTFSSPRHPLIFLLQFYCDFCVVSPCVVIKSMDMKQSFMRTSPSIKNKKPGRKLRWNKCSKIQDTYK